MQHRHSTIERLDPRRLLSAVVIDGTGGNDLIEVSRSGPATVVTVNGNAATYNDADTTSLTIRGLDGDDVIRVVDQGGRELSFEGGAGADRVEADGGAGLLRVCGGAGDDQILVNIDGNGAAEVVIEEDDTLDRLDIGAGGVLRTAPGVDVKLASNTSVNFGDLQLGGALIESDSRIFDGRSYYRDMASGTSPDGSLAAVSLVSDVIVVDYAAELGLTSLAGFATGGNDLIIRPTIRGDADLDGDVDLADFIRLRNNFGGGSGMFTAGDFNGDGQVDLADFILLRNNFGKALF